MTISNFWKTTSCAVSVAALLVAGASGTALAVEWDLPLAWPDGNFHTENAKKFADEVEKATDGEVVINIHSGGSLGFKGPEMLAAIRDGLVPIGDVLLNQQTGDEPILSMEALPFIIADMDELKTFHEYFRPVVEEVSDENNQKVLYVVPWPVQYVYTKVPVSSVADLQGLKIRAANAPTAEIYSRVGMNGIQMPWGEVIPALAAGTIDSVTTSASSGVDGKFWEFLDYVYPTAQSWSSNMVSVNKDAWAELTPEQQTAIEEVAARLEPEFWEVSRADDSESMATLTENGIELGEVSDEMFAEMREKTSPMIEEFIEANGPRAEEAINAFREETGK